MENSTPKFATPRAITGISKKLAYMYNVHNGIQRYHYRKVVKRFEATLLAVHNGAVPKEQLDKLFKVKKIESATLKPYLKQLKTSGLGMPLTAKGSEKPQRKSQPPKLTQLVLI